MNLKSTALILLGLILQLSGAAYAADDVKVARSLDEIVAAHQQTQIAFSQAASPEVRNRLQYVLDRLNSAEGLIRQALGSGGPSPFPPTGGGSVELYHSDSCSGELVALVNSRTSCQSLSQGARVWGVKINGKCFDIADTNADLACEAFKGATTGTNTVKIFHSDSCSGELVAVVNRSTRCEGLTGLSRAWGIEINGQCQDISDMEASDACQRFKP